MGKKILLGFLGIVLLIVIGGYAYYRIVIYKPPLINDADRAAINLMPLPAKLELKSGSVDLSNGLQINYLKFKNNEVEKSVDRFVSRLGKIIEGRPIRKNGIELNIDCMDDTHQYIQQVKEDESYILTIDNKQILLEAPSRYGVMRGLETLIQLIKKEDNTFVIPNVKIMDHPRFPWRGIMLDVCRHWMPKEVILRNLDAMSVVKLNVFHWHLTEDQGFRVESKVFPKLHEVGSNGKYYTQDEIREVIQYAADRGIRVVPEFDLPGHSKSWQMAYPELSTVSFPLKFGPIKGELFAPPMDPSKEIVYEFLDTFFEEMANLFPDPYIHIGGDEVNPKYWNESESVRQFMKEKGMKDTHDLQAYFNLRMSKILKKHGELMVGWEEILHPDLGDDIVIQSWKSQKSLFEGVQQGSKAILSAGYYLDHKLHAGQHYMVDPLVLAGAVDVVPDTANWKMYDMVMELPSGEMESQLILFDKDPQNVFGFFALLENRNAFKNGKIEDGVLTFELSTPMGNLDYSAAISGDSINGKLAFGLLKFTSYGVISGGSDMAETEMPKIEVMKPLTKEEEARIIGGEAAMWSEVVSAENVDSRLWPRSAAIAEKLWSPQELTTNVDDMYRRLPFISDHLTKQGSTHDTQYVVMLKKLGGEEAFDALKILVDVLEEVKYYSRLSQLLGMEDLYLPDLPLDEVVDAARPESLEARTFNLLVDEFMLDSERQKNKDEIIDKLEIWQKNHGLLTPCFDKNNKLKEIENISTDLSLVAASCLNLIRSTNNLPKLNDDEKTMIMEKLSFLETGENGVLVAVVPGLRRLVTEL